MIVSWLVQVSIGALAIHVVLLLYFRIRSELSSSIRGEHLVGSVLRVDLESIWRLDHIQPSTRHVVVSFCLDWVLDNPPPIFPEWTGGASIPHRVVSPFVQIFHGLHVRVIFFVVFLVTHVEPSSAVFIPGFSYRLIKAAPFEVSLTNTGKPTEHVRVLPWNEGRGRVFLHWSSKFGWSGLFEPTCWSLMTLERIKATAFHISFLHITRTRINKPDFRWTLWSQFLLNIFICPHKILEFLL